MFLSRKANYHELNYCIYNDHEKYTNQSLFADLTERQREIVRTIAAENVAANVTIGDFLQKYHLKSPSSVQSTLKGLSGKGVVGKTADGYAINDRLFKYWLKKEVR